MKLFKPAKLNSQSALTRANTRSFGFSITTLRSDAGRYGRVELRQRLCSRKTGSNATVVAASVPAAIRKGSGCHRPSKRPPASKATPSPAPRAIACPACARAYSDRGRRSA
jgi:hypothetical protein